MDRNKAVEKQRAKIAAAMLEIDRIQDECEHNTERVWLNEKIGTVKYPDYVTRVHKVNTGDWCLGDDRYWTECTCTRCGKHWTEEGSI